MTMPIPDGSVIITPTQMYDEIKQTRQAVESLTQTITPSVVDIRHDVQDHENRIRVVESRKYVTPAALAWAIGTAIACLGVLVTFLAIKGG